MRPRKQPQVDEVKTAQADAILRGEEAKRLLDNDYFKELMDRLGMQCCADILALNPTDTARFVELSHTKKAYAAVLSQVNSDIFAGGKALAQAQGEPTKTGRVA